MTAFARPSADAERSRRALLISGMHRSGTSLVAGYLRACGLHLGEQFLEADMGNPRGYFEDRELLNYQRGLFAVRGLDAFPTDTKALPINPGAEERQRALEIVRHRRAFNQWGWKDPRTVFLLDFWDDVIVEAKFLFVFRHPLLVVDSLLRRSFDPAIARRPVIGLKAWIAANESIIRFLQRRSKDAIVCGIEDFVQDAGRYIDRLNGDFAFQLREAPLNTVFARSTLRRTPRARTIVRLIAHPRELSTALRLYGRLCRAATA